MFARIFNADFLAISTPKILFANTVEPLIADTFTAKVRWPLLGGGRYSEVAALRGLTVPYRLKKTG